MWRGEGQAARDGEAAELHSQWQCALFQRKYIKYICIKDQSVHTTFTGGFFLCVCVCI